MSNPVSQLHLTGGALAIVAAVVGVLVARAAASMAQRSHPGTRLLFAISLINLSLLILIWSLPRAVGAHSPIATALTGPPALLYALPALVLLAASITPRNRELLPLNACVCCVALWAVMGFRFAVVAPPDPRSPFRIMSWKVGQSPHDLHAVVTAIRQEQPDIVCLQDSAPSGEAGATSDHLPQYHWYRTGDLAIGSVGSLTDRRLLTLSPDSQRTKALIAVARVSGLSVTVAVADLAPAGAQTDEAAGAADNLEEALKDAHKPIVVAASLGAQPASPSWLVLSHDLSDAFDRSGTGFGYTAPAEFPVRRIDYIFASRDLVVKSAGAQSDRGGDDLPVTATLGTPPPPPPVAPPAASQ